MKAMRFTEFGERPTIVDLPDPSPNAGGIVLEVKAAGLCRSDWHGWMGHDPDVTLPHVPGHELAGVVAAIGDNVRRWRVGDRVTLPFCLGCGACPECESGNQQVCPNQFQPGFTHAGGFAEYVALDYADTNLVALPDSLDYVSAASLGCRFVTAFRAVVDQGRVSPDEWVAVHGCGGVGLSAVMVAHALGAKVVAVDISDEALGLAAAVGADSTIHGSRTADVPAAIHETTGGGAHLSLDALGHPQTCANSVACLRRRGRHVQVGLLPDRGEGLALPFGRIISHELEFIGSHGMPAHRYPELLAMIEANKLNPARLVTKTITLDAAVDALVALEHSSTVGVTVIDRL
ncbi:MAG: zinc-dependent alcohol dehydrogenase family protein [Planctomycetota bacterium]